MASEDSDDGHPREWKQSPKVVIIGGGISGIAAARVLSDNGVNDFVILEATERLGGRIWSIDLETANGQKAELGANWIHGIDRNPIFKLAVEHNMLPHNFQGRKLGQKLMFVSGKGDPVSAKVVEEVDWTYGMLMAQVEDFYQDHMPTPVENDSVGAFLEREFDGKIQQYRGPDATVRKNIFHQRMLNESIINGCDSLHEMALSEAGSFEELPGVHHVIPGGFEAIVDLLKENIPEQNILTEHPVSQISWSPEGKTNSNQQTVCVECQNGKRIYADHVIVTVSLGYLKKFASRLFNPPLPEFKMESISKMAIGTVNKIVLEFESGPVLPDGIRRLEIIWDNSQYDENEDMRDRWHRKISFFEAISENVLIVRQGKQNVITITYDIDNTLAADVLVTQGDRASAGWLCGREAEYMETLPDGDVSKRCIEVLKGTLKSANIPPLKRIVRSNWKSMPYTLGSYSFIPVGATCEHVEALADPVTDENDKPVILFAGEATHGTFYSSSHGAFLSGEREAQRLLNLYNN